MKWENESEMRNEMGNGMREMRNEMGNGMREMRIELGDKHTNTQPHKNTQTHIFFFNTHFTGNLFCEECYLLQLAKVCAACGKPIIGMLTSAQGRVYHPGAI